MPGRRVWAVSGRGNVYTLSVRNSHWEQVNNQGAFCLQGFKKVSTLATCVWGLGCDHQVYVYVTSDLPIRCQQATYENERWIPSRGWSGQNLLPGVDPWMWSSDDCLRCLPKEDFRLPSEHWEWESGWYVDENVHGHLTDKGGWRYATLDFNHDFTHERKFKSCVRRRRWIRYCTFIANRKWARISSIHVDPLEEPIMEISAGGQDIPYQSPGFHLLYVITINGRLLYRSGISSKCPEGRSWEELSLVEGEGVLSASVGPRGALWVITWSGDALARVGVSQKRVTGKSWIRVEAPDADDRLMQIAVGVNAVWATTNTGKVWFRKGIKTTGTEGTCVEGTGWISMMHRMRMVAMAPNDQVWGIGFEDKQIFYRTGVTPEEQTGRNWIHIDLPYSTLSSGRSRHDSEVSETSAKSAATDTPTVNMSDYSLSQGALSHDITPDIDAVFLNGTSNNSEVTGQGDINSSPGNGSINNEDVSSNSWQDSGQGSEESERMNGISDMENNQQGEQGTMKSLLKAASKVMPHKQGSNLTKVSFSRSTGAINLGTEGQEVGMPHSESVSSGLGRASPDTPAEWILESAVEAEEESYEDELWMQDIADEGDIHWVWVSPAICYIPLESEVKHWLNPEYTKSSKNLLRYQDQLTCDTWRGEMLHLMKQRNKLQYEPFKNYQLAVEPACWSKKGSLRWWQDMHRGQRWANCSVELLQDKDQGRDGCFTIQYQYQDTPKYQRIPLHEILCCCAVHDFSCQQPVMSLYIQPRLLATPRLPPIRMAAQSEEELEDWMASLSVTCCDMRYIHGKAHHSAIWATSDRGDVFLHDADQYQLTELPTEMFWRQFGGHLRTVETNVSSVTWGLGYDGVPWVYMGGYGGGFLQGRATSPTGIHGQSDHRDIYIYENQRWRPVIGYSEKVLISDRIAWTDETGRHESTKEGTKLPSKHWQWVSDWQVDMDTPGGVDKEGWQYAKDFRGPFRGMKKLRSYVRRRRWVRRCQISVTGPWLAVEELKLKDISVQIDPPECSTEPVAVWAISHDGNVLCRDRATKIYSQGDSWLHVATDQPFTSISVGGELKVWATAKDGSAWLRGGVAPSLPMGECWYQVPPPGKGVQLRQISVGMSEVWAVDQSKNLWFRSDISGKCPEGQSWVQVCPNVRQVSVGPKDQVWAILDTVQIKGGSTHGVMGVRVKSQPDNFRQGHWEYGLGGGWQHICARSWLK